MRFWTCLSQFRHGIWPSHLRSLVFLTIPMHHGRQWGIRDATFVVDLHFSWRVDICCGNLPSFNQPSLSNLPPDQVDVSGQQKSDPLPIFRDESLLQDGDLAPASVNLDDTAIAKDKAQLDDRTTPPAKQSSNLKDAKQNLSYLAYYAYSEVPLRPNQRIRFSSC
jgi:hypothetical protein